MAGNLENRLSKLETSIKLAVPEFDWRTTKAYAALSSMDRDKLDGFADRFNDSGFTTFTDDELDEFEALIGPFAREEAAEA